MGMFDWLVIESELPEEFPEWCRVKGYEFQTKSLNNALDLLTITEDGSLTLRVLGPEKTTVTDIAYHGDIWFHTSNIVFSSDDAVGINEDTGEIPLFIEAAARFTEGKLTRIWVHRIDDVTRGRNVFSGEELKNHYKLRRGGD